MISRPNIRLWLFTALSSLATAASGQTISVFSSSPVQFGGVAAAASGPTTFRITPGGSVTVAPGGGNGGNIATIGPKTGGTVTLRCTPGGTGSTRCSQLGTVSVRVGARTVANGGRMAGQATSNFTVTAGSGATISQGSVQADGSYRFDISGWNSTSTSATQDRTFTLGLDQAIAGDNTDQSASGQDGYYVTVLRGSLLVPGTSPTTGGQGTITATVRRSLGMSGGTPGVSFGRITRPASGSGTATLATDSNTVTTSGGVATAGGTPTRATFTVTGQSGLTVALSFSPASTITLARDAQNSVSLALAMSSNNTLDGTGSLTVAVGGTLTIPSTVAGGDYSGSFNLVAAYN